MEGENYGWPLASDGAEYGTLTAVCREEARSSVFSERENVTRLRLDDRRRDAAVYKPLETISDTVGASQDNFVVCSAKRRSNWVLTP